MRGDVHRLKAPRDAQGHEQAGTRYGVVVQSDYLPLSTLVVIPTSTSARPADFRPEIEVRGVVTRVMVDQVFAASPGRLGDVVGHVGLGSMLDIERALRLVLGMPAR